MLLVEELNLASKLMSHSSHEEVVELVALVVPADLASVRELNHFVALNVESARVNPSLGSKTIPSVHLVETLRTLKQEVRDRRLVASLLGVYHRSIFSDGLVSLSDNGVQRFLKLMGWVNESDRGNHNEDESLDGVFGLGRRIHVERIDSSNGRHYFHDGCWAHAFNWETDRCQVELARQNLLSNAL